MSASGLKEQWTNGILSDIIPLDGHVDYRLRERSTKSHKEDKSKLNSYRTRQIGFHKACNVPGTEMQEGT